MDSDIFILLEECGINGSVWNDHVMFHSLQNTFFGHLTLMEMGQLISGNSSVPCRSHRGGSWSKNSAGLLACMTWMVMATSQGKRCLRLSP